MILLKRYIFPIFICGGKYVNHQFPSDLPSQTIKPLNATALSYWMVIIITIREAFRPLPLIINRNMIGFIKGLNTARLPSPWSRKSWWSGRGRTGKAWMGSWLTVRGFRLPARLTEWMPCYARMPQHIFSPFFFFRCSCSQAESNPKFLSVGVRGLVVNDN